MIIDIILGFATGHGGLETVLSLVSSELIRRGYRVRVIQGLEPRYKEWKSTINEFYVLNSLKLKDELTLEGLIEGYSDFIRKEGKPDIVIATHVPLMSYVCSNVLLMNNIRNEIPIISWIHGSLFAYGEQSDQLLQFADAHLAISKGIEKEIRAIPKEQPVYLINNPIDPNSKMVERAKGKFNIIYVGRFNVQKQVEVIFKALKYLKGDWEFNVYGDGEEKEKLLNLSKELGIEKNIIWHGWHNDVWSVITSASILVLSSIYEGCPMVLIEALSRGIPVVASNTEGSLNVVKEGINGWTFDIGDYKKLAEIINDIQSNKLKLPSQQVCVDSIVDFSLKNVVDKFEESMLIECSKKNQKGFLNENNTFLTILSNIKNDKEVEENLKLLNSLSECKLRTLIILNNLNNSLDFIKVLNKAAIINYNMENYEYVIPYLETAYEIDNRDVETLYNLSVVLYNIGEYKTSLQYLECIDNKDGEILELENILKEKVK